MISSPDEAIRKDLYTSKAIALSRIYDQRKHATEIYLLDFFLLFSLFYSTSSSFLHIDSAA